MATSRSEAVPGGMRATPILQDGLFAGLIGAFAVVVVFFVYDWLTGAPLRTPSVLQALIFEGPAAARTVEPEITRAVSYNLVHFLSWIAAGLVASFSVSLADARPKIWYLVFVAMSFVFVSLLYVAGSFEVPGLGRHHLWIGGLLGAASMLAYLWHRHPGLREHLNDVYDDA